MTVQEWLGEHNQLGMDIWQSKYCYRQESFEEWLDRVSGGDGEVRDLIAQKKFLFGGRILSNRGLYKDGVKVTYSNCYVLTPPEDSLESIFDCAKKLARTFSFGGGCGIDISGLAPRGPWSTIPRRSPPARYLLWTFTPWSPASSGKTAAGAL